MAKKEIFTLGEGLKYSWINAKRQWYFLWLLVPIFGWFALGAYFRKIIISFIDGKADGLPKMDPVVDSFIEGLKLFVMSLPAVIVFQILQSILAKIPMGWAVSIVISAIYYVLSFEFYYTMKMESWIDFKRVTKVFSDDLLGYIIAILKTIAHVIIYIIPAIFIVGIPGLLMSYTYVFSWYAKNRPKKI